MRLETVVLAVSALVGTAAHAERPRLGVLVVVDQLSADTFRARAGTLQAGLRRLVTEGAVFDECRYEAAPTVTAVGHATLATGAYGEVHGLAANEWIDWTTGESVTSVEDPTFAILGRAAKKHDGTSPKNLRVPTLADATRLADPRAKAVVVSGKDRSAILMAGRGGLPLYFDYDSPAFTSSTFYLKELPPFVAPVSRRLEQRIAAMPDGGFSVPGPLSEQPAVQAVVTVAEVDVALEAVKAMELGRDDVPDFLAVSFSGHDRIGHPYGPDSRESLEEFANVDRELGRLLAGLDAMVGKGRYVLALSSDHGVAPVPEQAAERGQDAGRVDLKALGRVLDAELDAALGQADWIAGTKSPGVALAPRMRARVGPGVLDRLRAVARSQPGVLELIRSADLRAGAGTFWERLYGRGYVPGRTPDFIVVPRPYWTLGTGDRTAHGTGYLYDRAVPLIFFGAGVKKAQLGQAEAIDVAPTLARLMGVPVPAGAQGVPIDAVVR